MNLDYLRRFAVNQSLFAPTTLKRALHRFGFVQADPIRARARAQDLILRHRVKNYRAGDLERNYPKLGIEEDFFVNYGFVTRSLQALMIQNVLEAVAQLDCRVGLLLFSVNSGRMRVTSPRALKLLIWCSERRGERQLTQTVSPNVSSQSSRKPVTTTQTV